MALCICGLTSLYAGTGVPAGVPTGVPSGAQNAAAPRVVGGVRDLSHTFRPNAVTAVLGPNGAGKSTLLRLLAGLREPTDPCMVTIDAPSDAPGDAHETDNHQGVQETGVPLSSLTAAARATRIAYVPQRPSVAFGFTALEVAGFGRPHDRGPSARRAAGSALQRVGLVGLEHRPIDTLSAGQQQLVSLARVMVQLGLLENGAGTAVCTGTRWLLADEPTSALDPRHASRVFGLLRAIASDPVSPAAVVVVVHDPTLARTHADEALVLDDAGRMHASGPVTETVTPDILGEVFGVPYAAFDGGRVLVPAV